MRMFVVANVSTSLCFIICEDSRSFCAGRSMALSEGSLKALLDHLSHHAIGVQCWRLWPGRRYHRRVPYRLLIRRRITVEHWLEHALSHSVAWSGARARGLSARGDLRPRVQRDEVSQEEIEPSLPVSDRQFVRFAPGRILMASAWHPGLQDHVPGRQIDRRPGDRDLNWSESFVPGFGRWSWQRLHLTAFGCGRV